MIWDSLSINKPLVLCCVVIAVCRPPLQLLTLGQGKPGGPRLETKGDLPAGRIRIHRDLETHLCIHIVGDGRANGGSCAARVNNANAHRCEWEKHRRACVRIQTYVGCSSSVVSDRPTLGTRPIVRKRMQFIVLPQPHRPTKSRLVGFSLPSLLGPAPVPWKPAIDADALSIRVVVRDGGWRKGDLVSSGLMRPPQPLHGGLCHVPDAKPICFVVSSA